VEDRNLNRKRPSSGAFDDDELSVDAEHLLEQAGLDWHFSLDGYSGYSLARLRAGEARSRNLPVHQKPLDDNPAHCEIHGRKTPGVAKALAKACTWAHLEATDV
jgi:hypothetical protein